MDRATRNHQHPRRNYTTHTERLWVNGKWVVNTQRVWAQPDTTPVVPKPTILEQSKEMEQSKEIEKGKEIEQGKEMEQSKEMEQAEGCQPCATVVDKGKEDENELEEWDYVDRNEAEEADDDDFVVV